METVLHAFNDLIARHPTVFRPFSAQIHSLLVQIIGSSTSTGSLPEQVVELSQKLFISLHNCAPKNTSGEEWTNACKLTIDSIHRAADHAFRSVIEQWESTDPNFRNATLTRDSSQLVGDDGPDPLGLPGWQGIHEGGDRLTALLRLLSGFMSTRTASTVNIPIGAVLDLTSRLTSVTVPREGDDDNVQTNPEIGREEREGLWIELPRIHVACIDLFSNILASLETGVISVAQNILEQTLWLFEAENFHSGIRAASYHLMKRLLLLVGPSMTKTNLSALSIVIRSCCRDVLPSDTNSASQSQVQSKDKAKGNQGSANADAFLNPALNKGGNQSGAVAFVGLQSAASKLFPILLSSLPVEYMPLPLRIELDRTAILAADQEAMMASVLNPVPLVKGRRVTPSILPFLARRYPKELEVECLLRPRMPVLIGGSGITEAILDEEEDEAVKGVSVDPAKTSLSNHTFENSVPPSFSNQGPSRADVAQNGVQSPSKRNLPEDTHSSDHTLSKSQDGSEEMPQTKKARLQSNDIAPSEDSGPSLLKSKVSPSLDGRPVASISGSQPVPATISKAPAAPATAPSMSAPSIASVSNASASASASAANRIQTTNVQQAGGQADGEESDEEIPALNIEPDTDEEEDEEDVSMEG